MARHNEIGEWGEKIAAKYLTNKGFKIVCQNYRKKWGEIDIIAIRDNCLHFVEVKTVSRKSYNGRFEQEINNYRPEDNMHPWKLKRLERAIQTYLLEYDQKKNQPTKSSSRETEWQFDLVCVFLDQEKRVAKVRFMQNIIL